MSFFKYELKTLLLQNMSEYYLSIKPHNKAQTSEKS